jgi:NADH:ubiquinone oxidoreductase subunit H
VPDTVAIILYFIGYLLFILFDYSFIALSLVILYIGALAILFYFAIFLILIVAFIPFMPFMTLADRYLLASIHRRIGPNVLSLLIPFATLGSSICILIGYGIYGLKLILKAIILPLEANSLLFLIAPLLSFLLALTQWLFLLLDPSILLFLIDRCIMMPLSSLTLYAIILAGWSANSKYALLGSLRSIAQMISYSIALSLLFLAFIFIAGSLNYRPIAFNLFILILFIIALIIAVAETNRAPFDLPEAESELVNIRLWPYGWLLN